MKKVFQLAIILGVSLLGELLNMLIPLPVPGSVYGLILMLLGLCTHIIPLESVETTGRFLVEIMPVMFIPAVVSIMANWTEFKTMLAPAIVAITLMTLVVMGVTGRVTQAVMRREQRKKGEKEQC